MSDNPIPRPRREPDPRTGLFIDPPPSPTHGANTFHTPPPRPPDPFGEPLHRRGTTGPLTLALALVVLVWVLVVGFAYMAASAMTAGVRADEEFALVFLTLSAIAGGIFATLWLSRLIEKALDR